MHSDARATCEDLQELQVFRKFFIGPANKQTNAAAALCRRVCGWSMQADEKQREAAKKRAVRIVTAALSGKQQKAEDADTAAVIESDLNAIALSIAPGTARRLEIEREMRRKARQLPIYEWAKSIKGLGEIGLAVIIGETGDLSNYPNYRHVWKRLGLAPFEGKSYSLWRVEGGLDAEDWTRAGYNPRRRAEIYSCVGDPLFRAQSVAKGPYRAIYDKRRAHTAITHADWTKAHSHNDALRIMTKALVSDLWSEWSAHTVVGQVTRTADGAPQQIAAE